MKAVAVFPHKRTVEIIDHPAPQISQPTDVLLRILEVGICGTDRHICSSYFGTPPPNSDYLILGHEAIAEVIAVGSQVQRLKAGDLVVPEVRRPCPDPDCTTCRAGRQDFCTTANYTERGIRDLHGYMTDMVTESEQYLNYVPPHLRSVAVLIEPLTIAEKAMLQVWQAQQRLPWLRSEATTEQPGRGLRAVVLGAGPIALLGAMLLVKSGFTTFVYSRSPKPNPKAALVNEIGATYFSTETTPLETFLKTVGPIDLVYEACDAAPLAFDILAHLGPNGVFVFTSQPHRNSANNLQATRAFSHIIGRNHLILGTINAGHDAFESAIQNLDAFYRRWPRALSSIITERYTLDEAKDLLLARPQGIKQIVTITS